MIKVRSWIITLLTVVMATQLFASVAMAATTTQVITNNDVTRQPEDTPPTDNWVLYTRTLASLGTFVVGPATPVLGVGSLDLVTPAGGDKVFLFNFDYVGKKLDTLDAIEYATYRTAGNAPQVASLNIQVDYNGPAAGGFTTLIFEPIYNTNQGALVTGQWQSWDAYLGGNAIWWSSQNIPGVCASNCFVTWNTILANNPDATILGGFGVNQGSGNPDLTSAVDFLTIGVSGDTITYNFEPYKVATSKADCKDGGWQTVTRADGTGFKNQGDCIQYVNTGK